MFRLKSPTRYIDLLTFLNKRFFKCFLKGFNLPFGGLYIALISIFLDDLLIISTQSDSLFSSHTESSFLFL